MRKGLEVKVEAVANARVIVLSKIERAKGVLSSGGENILPGKMDSFALTLRQKALTTLEKKSIPHFEEVHKLASHIIFISNSVSAGLVPEIQLEDDMEAFQPQVIPNFRVPMKPLPMLEPQSPKAEPTTTTSRVSPEERQLVGRAAEGDKEAFDDLTNEHYDQVYKYALYRLSSPEDAEDLAQLVFMAAFRAMPRYQITGAPFIAYLFTIAHNFVVTFYRKKRANEYIDKDKFIDERPGFDPEYAAERTEEASELKSLVRTLRPDYQEILEMRFRDNMSHREIAEVLGKTDGAVRVMQVRAFRQIRKRAEGKEIGSYPKRKVKSVRPGSPAQRNNADISAIQEALIFGSIDYSTNYAQARDFYIEELGTYPKGNERTRKLDSLASNVRQGRMRGLDKLKTYQGHPNPPARIANLLTFIRRIGMSVDSFILFSNHKITFEQARETK